MQFTSTPLLDAFTIALERKGDDRGFFARLFCENEFGQHGLERNYVQLNDAFNAYQGTLRGLHYQIPPHAEVKIVRCISGALWDVIVDLRATSPTFGKWFGTELTAENRQMMYVPKGFAHGYITLRDNTEIIYLVSAFYSPAAERGIRWNDPFFKVRWPIEPLLISERDRLHADFVPDKA